MSRLHRQKLRLRAAQRDAGVIEAGEDAVDRDAFQEVGTGAELHELRAERPHTLQTLRQAISSALEPDAPDSPPDVPAPQDGFAASLQAWMARGLTLQQAVDSVFSEYQAASAAAPSQPQVAPAPLQTPPPSPAPQTEAPAPAQNPTPAEPAPDVPRPAPDPAPAT